MAAIKNLCNHCIHIDNGHLVNSGDAADIIDRYLASSNISGCAEYLRQSNLPKKAIQIMSASVQSEAYEAVSVGSRFAINIQIEFAEAHKISDINIGIGIESVLGERVLTLFTKFDKEFNNCILANNEIVKSISARCVIPELPLSNGLYYITLYCDNNGKEFDQIINAMELSVAPSDYYGTGILPTSSQGYIVQRHQWSIMKTFCSEDSVIA